MPSIKLTLLSLGLALSCIVAGCAADTTADDEEDLVSSEDAIKAAGLAAGTFKLYAEPRQEPSTFCDVHTVLELKNGGGARAAIQEKVTGMCKLAVFPDLREYRLRLDETSCGSKIYKGSKRINGLRRTITLTDHRKRTCKDLVPAKIIVEETDRFGATQTKYSFDGAPPAPKTGTWLTIAPRQCGTNPWNGAKAAPGSEPSALPGEKGEVDNFFRAQGVSLEQIGFAYPAEPRAVCMACSCPRGDALIVKATTSADAAKLVASHGFAEAKGALTTAPAQCGSNPWEAGQQLGDDRAETQQLATWAKGSGATLAQGGFLDFVEPRMVCMACSCPRGDTAIAFPKDAAASTKLASLGWQRVEN